MSTQSSPEKVTSASLYLAKRYLEEIGSAVHAKAPGLKMSETATYQKLMLVLNNIEREKIADEKKAAAATATATMPENTNASVGISLEIGPNVSPERAALAVESSQQMLKALLDSSQKGESVLVSSSQKGEFVLMKSVWN